MEVTKAVITTAGRSVRMPLRMTPKSMLPLWELGDVRPIPTHLIDWILREISAIGIKDVCVVVGKDPRAEQISAYLKERVTFVTQEGHPGFGDAVLQAREFVGDAPFLLHAGDGVLTGGYREAAALFRAKNPDCILLLRRTDNPKRYGIATVESNGIFMEHRLLRITGVEEKPSEPKSNFMLSAVYIMKPKILGAIESATHDDEIEVTPGIQALIASGGKVYGLLLEKEQWLNVGDPDSYMAALNYTFTEAKRKLGKQ